jgi:hypothetical protein
LALFVILLNVTNALFRAQKGTSPASFRNLFGSQRKRAVLLPKFDLRDVLKSKKGVDDGFPRSRNFSVASLFIKRRAGSDFQSPVRVPSVGTVSLLQKKRATLAFTPQYVSSGCQLSQKATGQRLHTNRTNTSAALSESDCQSETRDYTDLRLACQAWQEGVSREKARKNTKIRSLLMAQRS